MKKHTATRRVDDMRHENNQNADINPARLRQSIPRRVYQGAYTGAVRVMMVQGKQEKVRKSPQMINGVRVQQIQAVGKRYE